MARVVITLSDNDDGSVHFDMQSEPGIPVEDGELTPAQAAAIDCLNTCTGGDVVPGAN